MKKRIREKSCHNCSTTPGVLYRCRYENAKSWVFLCKICLPEKQKQHSYQYGGTWKAEKKIKSK